MVKDQLSEAFIPYSRTELIQLCLSDDKLTGTDAEKFRDFCQILSAYYHFKLHHVLERLKDNFAPFNPDTDVHSVFNKSPVQKIQMERQLIDDFKQILERANYIPISQESLQEAFKEQSLIDLKTEVNFNEFEHLVCYCRGDVYKLLTVKKLFKKVQKRVMAFDTVVLLIKFREDGLSKKRAKQLQKYFSLDFKTIYIYLYKNLSKYDLEFIFPNIKMSMNWKDRLLFGIPAFGASISMIYKILPQILLIIGVIFLVTMGYSPFKQIQITKEHTTKIMPILITMFSLVLTFGGFAFKQYSSYKDKQIKFQKTVAETLFFRKMASQAGVFQYLIDAAEEEECKEMILVYYHLLISSTPLNSQQLDQRIEEWMNQKLGKSINFDIDKTLKNLQQIQVTISDKEVDNSEEREISLLSFNSEGFCHSLSLDEAKKIIDYVWDNAFKYSELT